MNRIKLSFIAAAVLVTTTLPAAYASANGREDEILANMQKAAAVIKTIHASLEQSKKNTQIGGHERYRGEIFFKHLGRNSDRLRIEYSVPGGRVVVVNDKQIFLFEKSTNQCFVATRGSLAQKNQEFAFFATPYSLTSAQIKARYDIKHVGDESVNGASTVVLELTPRGQSSVKKMKWWVDQKSWLPIKSQMVEQNGDISEFNLNGTEINGKLTVDKFDSPCPKGAERIER